MRPAAASSASLLGASLIALSLFQAGCGECPFVAGDRLSSPSNRLVAVIYDRNCGGGVLDSFSAYVGLRTADERDVDSTEVLEIIDAPHRPTVRWVDDEHLVVTVECRSDTSAWCGETGRPWKIHNRKRWRNVNIAYEAGPVLRKWSGDDILKEHTSWW